MSLAGSVGCVSSVAPECPGSVRQTKRRAVKQLGNVRQAGQEIRGRLRSGHHTRARFSRSRREDVFEGASHRGNRIAQVLADDPVEGLPGLGPIEVTENVVQGAVLEQDRHDVVNGMGPMNLGHGACSHQPPSVVTVTSAAAAQIARSGALTRGLGDSHERCVRRGVPSGRPEVMASTTSCRHGRARWRCLRRHVPRSRMTTARRTAPTSPSSSLDDPGAGSRSPTGNSGHRRGR
jgi:hypothetical protein